MNFHEAAEHFETDKGPRKATDRAGAGGFCGHGYTLVYEREFPAALERTCVRLDYVSDEPFALLEVGVQMGCSMRLWDWYFDGLNSGQSFVRKDADGDRVIQPIVVGLEIMLVPGLVNLLKASLVQRNRFHILEGDSTDPSVVEKIRAVKPSHVLREEWGVGAAFDVVIDDGSHLPAHQLATLQNLWPLVKPGGIYCIEDLHESYWPEIAQRGTLEPLLDQFWRDAVGRGKYAEWSGVPSRMGPPGIAEETFFSVRFYRNLVVLEKRLA